MAQPLAAVSVETVGDQLRFGAPQRLFEIAAQLSHAAPTFDYAPAADGQRFLNVRRSGAPGDPASTPATPVTIVVNWPEELRRQTLAK
jgi:hypothetical protein